MIGNVYARFKYEDAAQAASDALNSRWYAGRPIYCELSPVTDFREACCRLNSGEGCVRGGFCNFIHRKEPSPQLDREIELATKKWLRQRGRDERSVSPESRIRISSSPAGHAQRMSTRRQHSQITILPGQPCTHRGPHISFHDLSLRSPLAYSEV